MFFPKRKGTWRRLQKSGEKSAGSFLWQARRATFVLGTEVRREKNELALGMLVVGTAEGLISGLRRQLESILTFSSGDPLHLIVVTDNKSRLFVAEKLSDIVGRWDAVEIKCNLIIQDLLPLL